MAKNLLIVESPAKAKTIEKILGPDFEVKSCYGHIRDLEKGDMGIDVNNKYQPRYFVPDEKQKVVKELKSLAKKSGEVWLATDEDREGEAIAWHVYTLLQEGEGDGKKGKKDNKFFRIEFNEITKKAILEAIEKPRPIDLNRVNAQQARRILDRLVGYKLSPLLWKKVTKGLSAGRVQSVAVRVICDREEEIEAFTAEEYWNIAADMYSEKDKSVSFEARLVKIDGESIKDENKTTIRSEAEAKAQQAAKENAPVVKDKAAAKGVLNDPADAYKFLDLESFEVGDDGDVDDADVRFDGRKRIVGRQGTSACQCIEHGRLTNVREADHAATQAHYFLSSLSSTTLSLTLN